MLRKPSRTLVVMACLYSTGCADEAASPEPQSCWPSGGYSCGDGARPAPGAAPCCNARLECSTGLELAFECVDGTCTCLEDGVPVRTFSTGSFCTETRTARLVVLEAECAWHIEVPEWSESRAGPDAGPSDAAR